MLGGRSTLSNARHSLAPGRQRFIGRPAGAPGYHRRAWAMLVTYDGAPYKGWQPHPRLPTVAGVLGAALHRCGIGATPFGASRTDAGVHARAQVASFSTRNTVDPLPLRDALNAELPSTIRVLALREAASSFHAHWSSTGKVYRYRISLCGEVRAWRLPSERFPYQQIDRERLAHVLAFFEQASDVSAFARAREHDPASRRLTRAAILEADSRGVTLEFAAAGFGKYLVRNLVGGALGFAVGAYDEAALRAMLAREEQRPPRAEADGLSLHRVLYPPDLDPFADTDALVGT